MRLFPRSSLILALFICACTRCLVAAGAQTAADAYLSALDDALATTRAQMPAIIASAEQAAPRFIEHGRFYMTGPQKDFIDEANGRAGGLMSAHPLSDSAELAGSIVLYARAGALDQADRKAIEKLKTAGAYVVAFAARDGEAAAGPADLLLDSGKSPGVAVARGGQPGICPIDTLVNIVNLWTWTGELAGACTRLGKMPVFYQSYGMPGSRQRAKHYEGKAFHDDMQIAAIGPDVLGRAYVETMHRLLSELRQREGGHLVEATKWWREAGPERSRGWTIEHMFPAHFNDSRAPRGLNWNTAPASAPADLPAGEFILLLGYQSSPQDLLDEVARRGCKLVYVSSKPSTIAADNVLHIDACWPVPDGCVEVPGYDIPILPASGVMDAAIYWSMLAQFHSQP